MTMPMPFFDAGIVAVCGFALHLSVTIAGNTLRAVAAAGYWQSVRVAYIRGYLHPGSTRVNVNCMRNAIELFADRPRALPGARICMRQKVPSEEGI